MSNLKAGQLLAIWDYHVKKKQELRESAVPYGHTGARYFRDCDRCRYANRSWNREICLLEEDMASPKTCERLVIEERYQGTTREKAKLIDAFLSDPSY